MMTPNLPVRVSSLERIAPSLAFIVAAMSGVVGSAMNKRTAAPKISFVIATHDHVTDVDRPSGFALEPDAAAVGLRARHGRFCHALDFDASLTGRRRARTRGSSRREGDLISYYRARLNAAFVAGYRHGAGPVGGGATANAEVTCAQSPSSATTPAVLHRD